MIIIYFFMTFFILSAIQSTEIEMFAHLLSEKNPDINAEHYISKGVKLLKNCNSFEKYSEAELNFFIKIINYALYEENISNKTKQLLAKQKQGLKLYKAEKKIDSKTINIQQTNQTIENIKMILTNLYKTEPTEQTITETLKCLSIMLCGINCLVKITKKAQKSFKKILKNMRLHMINAKKKYMKIK